MSTNEGAGAGERPGSQENKQGKRGGNRGRSNSRSGVPQMPLLKKFIGKEEGLGDEFVYEHTEGHLACDQFQTTTEEIIRYSSIKFKNGADVERSLSAGARLNIDFPVEPTGVGEPAVLSQIEMMMFTTNYKIVLQRRADLKTALQSMYHILVGQCTKAIMEKVSAATDYTIVQPARDPIGLLGLIKGVMFNYNSRKYRAVSLIDIIKPHIISQVKAGGVSMSNSEYLEKFRTQLDVLKSAGGDLCGNHHGLILDELEKAGVATLSAATPVQKLAAEVSARSRFEGALFLMRSNQSKYGRLIQELSNDFNKGRDSYPKSLTEAYELMLHDVRDQDSRHRPHGNSGMAFNTVGETTKVAAKVAATNAQANPRPDVTCHKCGKLGHFSTKCAESNHANGSVLCTITEGSNDATTTTAVTLANIGSVDTDDYIDEFNFLNDGISFEGELLEQHKKATGRAVPSWWILLDNQSTVDVFCEGRLLKNIRKSPTSCRISCNAGVVIVNLIGDLPGYPAPVWYHPGGIANILSLHRVAKHCRVQYDSGEDRAAFRVIKPDGSV